MTFTADPITLRLNRNLTRSLKRGHPWVFADALEQLPKKPPGTPARLLDHRGEREIASGIYDPSNPLAFRVCSLTPGQKFNQPWLISQLQSAWAKRKAHFPSAQTSGFRLFNGEGDGLPGLVADIYGDTAVLTLDGGDESGPAQFWPLAEIARWLNDELNLHRVYRRFRRRKGPPGEVLLGDFPPPELYFSENGVQFMVDVVRGQKTGFFLDQRDNRQRVRQWAEGRRGLNVFGYTGGFSVYAGLGGASEMTTVDLAAPALEMATQNWFLNGLPPEKHHSKPADAFEFLDTAVKRRRRWDLVVLDPPSLAPSQKAVNKAKGAYKKLIAAGASVTESGGLLALSSCSSHINEPLFLQLCEEGLSQARRRGTVLGVYNQPSDHPWPLVCSELRYLKFVLLLVD